MLIYNLDILTFLISSLRLHILNFRSNSSEDLGTVVDKVTTMLIYRLLIKQFFDKNWLNTMAGNFWMGAKFFHRYFFSKFFGKVHSKMHKERMKTCGVFRFLLSIVVRYRIVVCCAIRETFFFLQHQFT